MNSLPELINAAIAEDERAARYAMQVGGNGTWTEQTSGVICLEGVEGLDGLVPVGDLRLSRHMVRNSPARTLRRASAYRKILAIHHDRDGDGCYGCGLAYDGERLVPDVNQCETLIAIAAELDIPCGAKAVFWPDDEACDAECILHIGHEGVVHTDDILGDWSERELPTTDRFGSR